MITIETIYDLYVYSKKDEIYNLEKEKKKLEREREKIKKILIANEETLVRFCSLYDLYEGRIKEIFPYRLKTNLERYVGIQVKLYYNSSLPIESISVNIDKINKSIIPFELFRYCTMEFNKQLVDEIIDKRYEFFQTHFGSLKCVFFQTKKKKVNWQKSMENKERIENEGKQLYYKEEADLALLEGKEYNGIPWLEYFNDEDKKNLYMYWNTAKTRTNRLISGISSYRYVAQKGNNSVINKLVARKKLIGEAIELYKETYE